MDCIVHGVTKRQTLLSDFLKLCNLVCTLESVQTQNGPQEGHRKQIYGSQRGGRGNQVGVWD